MKISVIIPYKNAGAHIQRCIDSCQTASGDFEFIFVNDNKGETADAEAVRKAMIEDERIIGIRNHQAPGVSGARNSGLDVADGEWITFLDADDEILPDAHKTFEAAILRVIENAPEFTPIIQLNHLRYYAKFDKLTCKYANDEGIFTIHEIPQQPQCWCMVWNKLILQEWLEDNHIRFTEGLQYGEDELFVVDMVRKHPKIYHAPKQYLAIKRNFDNMESLSQTKNDHNLWKQIAAIERKLIETNSSEIDARCLLCDILSEHWQSPTFKSLIGGRKNG